MVKSAFQDLYSEKQNDRPTLDGIPFKCLTVEGNEKLSAPFCLDEIKEAVWSCDGDKSPGPDGFNFRFFKQFWEGIKNEVGDVINEFYENDVLPKGICSSFVTLIPNRDNPQGILDFRPISLIGSIHKLIPKLLAARLKCVLTPLISHCQSAFLANRQILDGVLTVSEVVDLARKKKEERIIFKVDFEKAYDSVSWGFLE